MEDSRKLAIFTIKSLITMLDEGIKKKMTLEQMKDYLQNETLKALEN
jgi:hypothetical protein